MSKAVEYIKCPRCELNYIIKKDKFCDVCKSEMKAGILEENEFDELEEGLEICPICKVNYINEGESMCSICQEEKLESSSSKDDEPDWRGFVEKSDEEDEDLDLLPIEEDDEIDEELEGAFAKDLDSEFGDDDLDEDEESIDIDDDFDDVNVDDDDIDDEDDEDDYADEDDDDLI